MSRPMQLATLPAPVAVQVGDVATFEGTRWIVRRNGVVIANVNLAPISQELQQSVVFGNAGSINEIFWSKPMANQQQVLTNFVRNNDGSYDAEWEGGTGRHFNNWEEVENWANIPVNDPDTARQISLGVIKDKTPDGTGVQAYIGTKVTISYAARGNEVSVETPPQ